MAAIKLEKEIKYWPRWCRHRFLRAASLVQCVSWTIKQIMQQDGSASFGAFFWGGFQRDERSSPRRGRRLRLHLRVQYHITINTATAARLSKPSRGGVLSVCPQMRVDEPRPSSARGETPRRHVPHVAVSLFVPSPASGPENAAAAAEAQKAAAHPARRRGEERPHSRRRGDGVEALLRHHRTSRAAPRR